MCPQPERTKSLLVPCQQCAKVGKAVFDHPVEECVRYRSYWLCKFHADQKEARKAELRKAGFGKRPMRSK